MKNKLKLLILLVCILGLIFNCPTNAKEGNTNNGELDIDMEGMDVETTDIDLDESQGNVNNEVSYDKSRFSSVCVPSVQIKGLNGAGPQGAIKPSPEEIATSTLEVKKPIEMQESKDFQTRASWMYLDDQYTIYSQQSSTYCGPACVESVLKYIKGTSSTQPIIGMNCGTDQTYDSEGNIEYGTKLAMMQSYVNSELSGAGISLRYYAEYGATLATMKSCLYAGVVTYDMPSVIGVKVKESGGWLYDSAGQGHYITVCGAMSDKSAFIVGDPWIKYSGSGLTSYSAEYEKTAIAIYVGYTASGCGLMY